MLQIRKVVLLCPLLACFPGIGGQVGSLRINQEPHGVETSRARHWSTVSSLEFPKSMLHANLVRNPVALHKDEAVEHHARTNKRNPFQPFLENDVYMPMQSTRVRDPPQIQPVCVDLIIRYQQ